MEIEDRTKSGEPTSYVFTREATRWMMASPAVAKATSKVEELTQAMSRLRVIKWHDDRMDRLLAYGLKPAALTIRATVTQDVPAEYKEPQYSMVLGSVSMRRLLSGMSLRIPSLHVIGVVKR